jgi:hypothetical protein
MPISEHRKAYLKQYRQDYKKQAERWSVTLTKKEANLLRKRAEREGIKPNVLIKNLAFAYHQKETYVPEDIKEELRKVYFLFLGVANNINQMSHYSHTVRTLVEENNFLMEIKKLEDMARDYFMDKLKSSNQP